MKKNITKKPATKKGAADINKMLSALDDAYLRFQKGGFELRSALVDAGRQRIEQIKTGAKADSEGAKICSQIHEMFLNRHIELTVAEVSAKYGIEYKPTEEDFNRICAGEKIHVINDDKKFAAVRGEYNFSQSIYAVCQSIPDESFLSYKDGLTGKAKLDELFQLLGYHFLHRHRMLSVPFNAITTKSSQLERNDAMQFGICFTGKEYEAEPEKILDLSAHPENLNIFDAEKLIKKYDLPDEVEQALRQCAEVNNA